MSDVGSERIARMVGYANGTRPTVQDARLHDSTIPDRAAGPDSDAVLAFAKISHSHAETGRIVLLSHPTTAL